MDDLRTAVQDSWSKALLAASSVEEQAQAMMARLQQFLDGDAAQRLVSEITGKLHSQRQQLQAEVERAIESGFAKMRLPSRAEVEALRSRVKELEERVSHLEQGNAAGGGRPSA